MTFTWLSDTWSERPDLLAVSREARLLHVEALVYCNRQLTDGELPLGMLRRITDADQPDALAQELEQAGLWQAGSGHWLIDWTDQEQAEDVIARRRKSAEKQQRHRRRRAAHADGDHTLCDPRFCREATSQQAGHVTRDVTSNDASDVTNTQPTPAQPSPARRAGAGADAYEPLPSAGIVRCDQGYPVTSDGNCCAHHGPGATT